MADEIKVNTNDWSGLSKEDQEKVTNILTATGLLPAGSSITPDANAKPATGLAPASAGGLQPAFPNLCKPLCDIAETAAIAACAALSGPAAAVCIAAAKAGGEFCRSKCKK